jgi:hypothetical protein
MEAFSPSYKQYLPHTSPIFLQDVQQDAALLPFPHHCSVGERMIEAPHSPADSGNASRAAPVG